MVYEWTVMPFGLKNAPATFVKLMDEVFQEHLDKFMIVYLDDIVVYSKSVDEHLHHLQLIFSRLRQHKLYAKLEKCQFMQREIKFLGHLVSSDGIRVNPDKVKAIQEWPVPKTVKDIRVFLGASGYYRKFILNYSKVASPLTELLKDEQPSKWQEEQSTAFNKLKDALSTAPVSKIPDTAIPFKIKMPYRQLLYQKYLIRPYLLKLLQMHVVKQVEQYYHRTLVKAPFKLFLFFFFLFLFMVINRWHT